jgi:Mg2+ and Co2+ transporter CorA
MSLVEALQELSKARRYVVKGERCLSHQRKIVERLEREGNDPLPAIMILEHLEHMQDTYVAHRDQIEARVLMIIRPE